MLRNFLHISTSHQYDIQNIQCFTQTFFFSWRGAIQTELPGEVVESVALNRVSSALRAVLQLQQVHTVHLVDGKAFPVADL